MLSATLYTRVKQGGAAPAQRMPLPVMLEELGFLSQLLKNEFVYGTEGLQANAMNTVSSLEVRLYPPSQRMVLLSGGLVLTSRLCSATPLSLWRTTLSVYRPRKGRMAEKTLVRKVRPQVLLGFPKLTVFSAALAKISTVS